jgi:hypothetical protein
MTWSGARSQCSQRPDPSTRFYVVRLGRGESSDWMLGETNDAGDVAGLSLMRAFGTYIPAGC